MDTVPRIRIGLLCALAILFVSGTGARGIEPIPHAPGFVVIEGGNWTQRSVLRDVLGRFRRADLAVPDVVIRFAPDPRVCGKLGGFIGMEARVRVIVTCLRPGNGLRHNLLHEISHAWEAGGELTDAVRARFLELRGLQRWHDTKRDDWPYRGAEQAAEIVAWGLEDEKMPIPTRVGGVGRQDDVSLLLAFEMLTGRDPLWAGRAV